MLVFHIRGGKKGQFAGQMCFLSFFAYDKKKLKKILILIFKNSTFIT